MREISDEEIKEFKHDLKTFSFALFAFVIVFGYWFHKYAVKHEHQTLSILLVTVMPAAAIIYNIYYNLVEYKDTHSYSHELKEFNKEMNAESKFYELIALLLFGVGLIYAEFKKYKYLSMVLPYLLFALLFGTIIPAWTKQFVFDYYNLNRLLKIDVITFCMSALATGLLTTGILVPVIYHSSKRGIAG
jgi:hypothetical protein